MEDVQKKAIAAGVEELKEWLAHRRCLIFLDALVDKVRLFSPLCLCRRVTYEPSWYALDGNDCYHSRWQTACHLSIGWMSSDGHLWFGWHRSFLLLATVTPLLC